MRSILILLLPIFVMAEGIELLYDRVVQSNSFKSKAEKINGNFQNTKASVSSDGFNFGAGVAYADLKDGSDSGTEYELSLAKELQLSSAKIDTFVQQSGVLAKLQTKSLENRYKVELWQLYGDYCVAMEALQAKAELSSVYEAILSHIEKGVEYGEFDSSKMIVSSLALENLNLELSKLENLVQTYEARIKVLVDFDGQFECKNLEADIEKLFDPEYSALWPVLESNVDTSRSSLSLAQQKINSLNLEAKYTNELDTNRYTLNVSLPLYMGDKSEAQRASAMSAMSAANYELEALREEYRHESSDLKGRLDIYKKYLLSSEKTILNNANRLIKQSNMRFLAGEESFLSMIKATESKLQMIETILDLKLERHNAVAGYMYKYSIDPQGVKK